MAQVEATPIITVPGGEDSSPLKKESTTPSTFDLHSGVKAYVLHLVYWEDVTQSALVLCGGSLFYIITHIFDYSVISLASWMCLVLILLAMLSQVAAKLCVGFGYPVHPLLVKFQHSSTQDNLLDEALVLSKAREFSALVNKVHKLWNLVLSCSDLKLSFQAAFALWLVAAVFQRVTLMTLLFVVFSIGMTAPYGYHNNQKEIDAAVKSALEQLKAKSSEALANFKAQVGPAKEAALVKVAELKAKALVVLQDLVAKLPPNVQAKLAPYVSAASPVVEAETKKND